MQSALDHAAFGVVAKFIMLYAKNQEPSRFHAFDQVLLVWWMCVCGFCDCNMGFVLLLLHALVQMDDLASSLSVIQYYTMIQYSVR